MAVRITQIYYNGGIDADASYANDFVEIYNDSDTDVVFNGDYAIAVSPNGWQKILEGTIKARSFYLVQYASWFQGGATLPTPDFVGQSQDLDGNKWLLFYYQAGGNFDNPVLIDDVNFRDSATSRAPTTDSSIQAVMRKKSGAVWQDTGAHGNDFQLASPFPRNSAYVAKTTPTLTWLSLSNLTYPAALSTNQLSATSSAPGTFAYALINGTNISTNTVLSAGTNKLVATFTPTDTNAYSIPSPITNTLVVNKANQTITFAALADKVVGDANFNLSATITSGLGVSFASSDSNVVTISESVVTILGKGTSSITASQAGDSNWNAATNVAQTLTVKSRFAAWSGTETMTTPSVGLYAIGGASNSAASPERLTGSADGTNLVLVAIVRTNDPKLQVVGETSTNLANPNGWATNGITSINSSTQSNVPSGHVRKVFSASQTNSARKFLRLKSTLNP